MVAEIENITPFSNRLSKLCEIGDTMSIFFNLHVNERYDRAMRYGMHFIGYLDNLSSISDMHLKGRIAKCKLTKGECKFTDAYYAPLHGSDPVSNSYSLDGNMIITGPNASGKTTLLKTTLFNLLFTQQCGLGFYKKATINPYSKFHCYLNIPDTSARDSLFQAEARRCKEILDSVGSGSEDERHFCIFDELYSGTNPYEAVASSHSLLEYLSKTKCTFLLTTHFLELCHKLDDLGNVSNCQMSTKVSDDDTFVYEYKLKKGISEIKGGLKILKGLDYPEAILSKAKESLGRD
jgi:DNA mismatch repair ATPase MutS